MMKHRLQWAVFVVLLAVVLVVGLGGCNLFHDEDKACVYNCGKQIQCTKWDDDSDRIYQPWPIPENAKHRLKICFPDPKFCNKCYWGCPDGPNREPCNRCCD